MFIVTAKLNRNRLIGMVVCAGLLLIALVILVSARSWRPTSAQGEAVTPSPKGVSGNDERVSYLHGFGWEVEEDAVEFQEVLIPERFDGVLRDYGDLQKEQGFNLEKYRGRLAKRYTYLITNYPGANEDVYANLLIYKNTVIAGDVSSANMDGFLHGLLPGAA
ncbi:MAG: DUF4830 domain-containing protein [Oscillospiraceae bacterium]|nr:DUF4830 domain-containing protein [Oscillospiraceae bacterium]